MTGWSRRAVLRGTVALGGAYTALRRGIAQDVQHASCDATTVALGEDVTALAALAARQGRWFGCSVKDSLFDDEPFQQLVIEQCNLLVCTYSMKWRHLEPQPGQFKFQHSDRYVAFAEQHGMEFRGHTLVWERELPDWLGEELDRTGFAVIERHVREVARHYAGRLQSWDVVNEAVKPADGRADRLKANTFLQTLGPSYIEAAFFAAREADPSALLYYNSNPAPYGRPGDREHFEGVIALLERLKSRDVPIQGLGMQGHLAAALEDQFDERIVFWFLERATDLGLEVMITELDVTDKWMSANVTQRDRRVAATYRRFLDLALAFPAVRGVLTWGLSDRYTGLNRWPREDGWAVRGLPYDHCLQPKLARNEIAAAFLAHDPDRA